MRPLENLKWYVWLAFYFRWTGLPWKADLWNQRPITFPSFQNCELGFLEWKNLCYIPSISGSPPCPAIPQPETAEQRHRLVPRLSFTWRSLYPLKTPEIWKEWWPPADIPKLSCTFRWYQELKSITSIKPAPWACYFFLRLIRATPSALSCPTLDHLRNPQCTVSSVWRPTMHCPGCDNALTDTKITKHVGEPCAHKRLGLCVLLTEPGPSGPLLPNTDPSLGWPCSSFV